MLLKGTWKTKYKITLETQIIKFNQVGNIKAITIRQFLCPAVKDVQTTQNKEAERLILYILIRHFFVEIEKKKKKKEPDWLLT